MLPPTTSTCSPWPSVVWRTSMVISFRHYHWIDTTLCYMYICIYTIHIYLKVSVVVYYKQIDNHFVYISTTTAGIVQYMYVLKKKHKNELKSKVKKQTEFTRSLLYAIYTCIDIWKLWFRLLCRNWIKWNICSSKWKMTSVGFYIMLQELATLPLQSGNWQRFYIRACFLPLLLLYCRRHRLRDYSGINNGAPFISTFYCLVTPSETKSSSIWSFQWSGDLPLPMLPPVRYSQLQTRKGT